MNHRLRFSCQLLLPGLALGSSLLALPSHADDTTGTALAAALNKQWLSSVESCTRGNDTLSALACSGVLLKTLPDTVAEKKMGAGGLLYLRHDLNPPAHLTGAVMPAGSALNPDAKGPGAACVRPVAVSTDTVRSGYGCGAATGTPSETGDSDASTCNQQEKGPGEAGWKWDGSCSLSVEIAPEFSLAMKLNQDSKGANPARNAMQVWYHRWPASLEGAKPQALVYTSGNDGELKARQADWASLKSAGLDVPVLKYTPGNATSPFSYVQSDNDVTEPPVLTREAVQKKLDALFDNKKVVKFFLVPPSFTKNNHTLQSPRINTGTKTVEATNPFTPGTLTYSPSYSEFKDMSQPFYNLNDNAILYGFIVDDQGHPAASIYAPYGSASGRRAAVALAKQYNIQTNSTLPVAVMNVKATTTFDFVKAMNTGGSAFYVNLIGNEDEIQKGGEDTLEEKAQKVINRYSDTRESCPNNTPAWQCSGLIMRASGSNNPFTQSPDVVRNRGVASYSYLRQDTNTNRFWGHNQAIVLKVPDMATAGSSDGKKTLDVLKDKLKCIYPHDAQTDHNFGVVGDYQCHKTNTQPSSSSDLSDCAMELKRFVPDAEADSAAWVSAWHNKSYTWSNNQCAFSVQHAGQFYAATRLTTPSIGEGPWNELILAPSADENDIPELEAVLYIRGNGDALNAAKEIARKYQKLRMVTLPLISLDSSGNLRFEDDKQLAE
jgi:hypothetical protein